MRLSTLQKGILAYSSKTDWLIYVETRQEMHEAEVPRHHLAAKSHLIAPSKLPQNALSKKCGMTQHVVGEVLYDCGTPSTVTVKAVIKEKCGFAKCQPKGHTKIKCLKKTAPSPATRTVCVQPNINFVSTGERLIDCFNTTSSIICFGYHCAENASKFSHTLRPRRLLNQEMYTNCVSSRWRALIINANQFIHIGVDLTLFSEEISRIFTQMLSVSYSLTQLSYLWQHLWILP